MQITTDLFIFPFKDPRWKGKFAVGALIGLLGLVLFPLMWLLMGYGVAVMRQTIRDDEPRLPEWSDWGGLFLDGLRHLVVYVVYTLPFTLLLCIVISGILLLGVGAPALMMANEELAGLGVMGFYIGLSVGMVAIMITSFLLLPLIFLSMVGLTRAIALDRLSAAFEFGEVMKMARAGFGNYLLALVMWYVAVFAASFFSSFLMYTVVLCILYPILYGIILVYSPVLQGALLGLAYNGTVRTDKLDAPKPPSLKAKSDAPRPAADMGTTPASASTPPPPAPPPATDVVVTPADQRDDLTQIAGIGKVTAQRLYDAGITTFHALAAQSPERIREITQTRANVQAWIDAAHLLAGTG